EQRNEASRVHALAAQYDLAASVLATRRRLHLELREPRVVGQQLGHVLNHLQRGRERELALQREVVVAGQPLELVAQRARRVGLHFRLVGEPRKRDRVDALLPDRQRGDDQRDEREGRERNPDLPTAPLRRLGAL